MDHTLTAVLSARTRRLGFVLASLLLVTVFTAAEAPAQTKPTDGSTPLGLQAGAPAGSYSLGDFDNVNLYNGALSFRLPLLTIGGRGGASHTILLPVERHWMAEYFEDDQGNFYSSPVPEREEEIKPGYGPGVMALRFGGNIPRPCPTPLGGVQYEPLSRYQNVVTRLYFTAPDGTETLFKDQVTGGQARAGVCPAYTGPETVGFNRGRVFFSADGSAATFVSDSDITDQTGLGVPESHEVSGYMLLRDGTRYRIDGGSVSWIRDRNGNKISFTYDANHRMTSVTDSLNRQVGVAYDVAEGGQYGTCDRITYKGFGGAARVIRVSKTNLGSALRAGYSLSTTAYLFPALMGSTFTNYDPTVVSAVWLPDGVQSYQLRYNPYAELARVVLPTGGAFEYDYAGGTTNSTADGVIFLNSLKPQIYRRVSERRVLADGANVTSRNTYSRPETEVSPCCSVTTQGYVDSGQYDGAGNLLAFSRHYFNGPGAAPTLRQLATSLALWSDGKEYKTESFNVVNNAPANVLRRSESTWQEGPPLSSTAPVGVDGRVVETVTTLADTNQVAKTSAINPQTGAVGFDQFNNRTDVWEYDYGAGAAGALVRHTRTDYLVTNPANGVDYTSYDTAHIRSLPAQVSVYDAAGAEQARTTFEYDYYAQVANRAPLVGRSNISGLDAAYTTSYTTRGNVTATSRWLLPAGTPVTAYAQYDVAGNVLKAIDPRGYQTTLDFTDRFGSPDGEARANSQPAGLGAQATYAFATSATNAAGHTAYTQFDYYLGKPVEVEDINGVVSGGYYNDVLDRPTQLVLAWGTGVQSQTTFSYDDAARVATTTGDLSAYGDNLLKSEIVYDQLGRTYESRRYESATNYTATQRSYDALGRAYRMSNPYRPWQGQTPVWTTTQFDALGRTIFVTSPDGSQVSTSFSGNQATVTDQQGKSRKSVTDALGRMRQVFEDPSGLNYETDYDYDALGNLRRTLQGGQKRYFMYDSLGRLLRAKLPEQGVNQALDLQDAFAAPGDTAPNSHWSAGYDYDAGGNLWHRTDARNVTTTYAYDALGRGTTTDYSTTAVNPDVERYYDNPTAGAYGKGRFWYAYAGGNYSAGSDVEHTAVDSYDAAGRPLVQRQMFKTAGAWSSAYQMSQAYNRAGMVTSETYPSGHTANHTQFDGAGRLQSVTGTLGDGVQRTYSTGITYDAASRMQQEQFGTDTPLYHKLHYNVRGQLYDIRLSTLSEQASPWDWNRGALLNYYSQAELAAGTNEARALSGSGNNGNLKRASVYVPLDPNGNYNGTTAGSYFTAQQTYSYDTLNRLTRADESTGLTQAYTYDRFGNRQIDADQTTAGLNSKQFVIDAATNRLTHAGMAYDDAGNLTQDTYSASASQRAYDAENRMTMEQNNATSIFHRYAYDADGRRTRRDTGGQITWQVYGFGGELLAEYAGGAAPSSPQKEYGYRGGELLITASSTSGAGRVNVAAASNGAIATAQNFTQDGAYPGLHFQPLYANDGVKHINPPNGDQYWRDEHGLPSWLEIDFAGSRAIDEVDVYTVADHPAYFSDPTQGQTFTQYGVTAFTVQYWTGTAWASVPGGSVPANNLVWKKINFAAVLTSKIRIVVSGATDGVARIAEVEAYASSDATAQLSSFVTHFYTSILNRQPTGAELSSQVSALSAALSQGQTAFFNAASQLGQSLFFSQEYADRNRTDHLFVYDLFVAFLSREPDSGGWAAWEAGVPSQGRPANVYGFSSSGNDEWVGRSNAQYSAASAAQSGGGVNWLVCDHLGTPRMVVDQTGSLAGVKRHDYLPFGEELYAGAGGRTSQQGYYADAAGGGVKQKYTGYEQDLETGLDFAQARYHSSPQGRFTSIDPLSSSAKLTDPQSLNRYSYVGNNPVVFSDPSGMDKTHMSMPSDERGRTVQGLHDYGQGLLAEDEARYEYNLTHFEYYIEVSQPVDGGLEQAADSSDLSAAAETQESSLNNNIPGVCRIEVTAEGPRTLSDRVGIRFYVRGDVGSGGIGKVGDGSEDEVVQGNLPGGGKWQVGQMVAASVYESFTTNILPPETRYTRTKDDSPTRSNREIQGNSFSWHDTPGFMRRLGRADLEFGEAKYNFIVYAQRGRSRCEIRFHVRETFSGGKISRWSVGRGLYFNNSEETR